VNAGAALCCCDECLLPPHADLILNRAMREVNDFSPSGTIFTLTSERTLAATGVYVSGLYGKYSDVVNDVDSSSNHSPLSFSPFLFCDFCAGIVFFRSGETVERYRQFRTVRYIYSKKSKRYKPSASIAADNGSSTMVVQLIKQVLLLLYLIILPCLVQYLCTFSGSRR
jgi:hypothetical protein